jgi:hypothetical protein
MMAFQFLGPIIASVLYVIVFQKAGFGGPMPAFCAAPLLGAFLTFLMVGMGGMVVALVLINLPLSLLPLLILAFMPWPPVAAGNSPSEK